MAAAPVLLYQTRTAGSELLCECKIEPGAQCPMHGGKAHEAPGTRKAPRFSPVCGDQTAAALTLLASSGGGLPETSSTLIRPVTNPVATVGGIDALLDANGPPASPPPRV